MEIKSRVTVAANRLCVSALVLGSAVVGMSSAFAQSVASGPDITIQRACANFCVQQNENVVVDNAGNAVAVWEEKESDNASYITASQFDASANTWSQSRRLGPGSKPAIAMDGSGNVLAIWDGGPSASAGNYNDLVYSKFIAAQGAWNPPSTAAFESIYFARTPLLDIAKNGDGSVILRGSGEFDYYVMRFDAATSTFRDVDRVIIDPKMGSDDTGNTVYADLSGIPGSTDTGLAIDRWNNETKTIGFGGYLDRSQSPDSSLKLLAATKDAYGGEMVLWQRAVTSSTGAVSRDIRSARYQPSKGTWIYKDFPEINNNAVIDADMDADRFGNVHAVWTQYVGPYARVVSARYSSSTGVWSTPKVISVGEYRTRDASLDADDSGNVIATWSQRTDTGTGSSLGKIFKTTAARYSASTNTWGTPLAIQDVDRIGYRPFMGVDGNGRAVVIWNQDSWRVVDGQRVKVLRADRVFPK